ncbi:hypothetical protein [Parendozoicomonas haliclonae]|uniref:Uncharacterized protein n=1 Tax=Parendozoicomonas haliclonae TaxID=1960125 RepID=A0A1X7AML5_9GAMM|nr:hypothetical protein [Parendozoicomonas haliclonae]SMA49221.1 hypothetical protein EHSB41UT_03123 [Parendozoicomonas haliclonae]
MPAERRKCIFKAIKWLSVAIVLGMNIPVYANIDLQQCLNGLWQVPDGPYLKELCEDNDDCLNRRVSYLPHNDELRIILDDPGIFSLPGEKTMVVSNACALVNKGFKLHVNIVSGWIYYNHTELLAIKKLNNLKFPRYDNIQEQKNDRPDDALSMTEWLNKHENSFKYGCKDIIYDNETDTLHASCKKEEHQGRFHGQTHIQSSITYLSIYRKHGAVIINSDGRLKPVNPVSEAREEDYTQPIGAWYQIMRTCADQGMTHRRVGNIITCHNPGFMLHSGGVTNCTPEDVAYNSSTDLLLLRCRGNASVFQFSNTSVCASYENIYSVGLYSRNTINEESEGDTHLFCRVSRPLIRHTGL